MLGHGTYESVAGNADLGELLHPGLTLLSSEGSGDLLKDSLKGLPLRTILGELAADEQVNGVALVGALSALLPLDAEDTLVEAHPPVVGLVACKTSTVDTGLLTGAETNNLAVDGVTDRVALGVLEGDGGDGKVASSLSGEGAGVLGGDDGAEVLGRDLDIVAGLLEVDAVYAAGLDGIGVVIGINLEHQITAALLLLEDLKGLGLITGGNDTIRDLLGDDLGGGDVNHVAQSNHVTEAAHTVGTSGTSIGLGEGRLVNALNVMDKVDLLLILGEGKANGGTSRRDVLEAGGGRLAEGLLELLDQGPGVEGIEEVDVAGGTAEDLEGQVALGDIGGSGLLVGVGAVSESKLLLAVTGVLLAEELGDGGIVVGSVLEGFEGVLVSAGLGDLSLLELLEETGIILGVAEDGDTLVVLGGSTDEGDTTNVNLLNGLGDADIDLGYSVLEGVEVADDIVDLVDVLLGEVLLIGSKVTGQDAGMDGGVEGLDTASQHLGGLGDGRDVPV